KASGELIDILAFELFTAQLRRVDWQDAERADQSAVVLQLMCIFRMIDDQVISKMSRLRGGPKAGDKLGLGTDCDNRIDTTPRSKVQEQVELQLPDRSDRCERAEDRQLDDCVGTVQPAG